METKTYHHTVEFWMNELPVYKEMFDSNSQKENELEILLRIFLLRDQLRDKMMERISKSFVRKHFGKSKTKLNVEEQLMVIRKYLEAEGGRAGYCCIEWDYTVRDIPKYILSAASPGEDQSPVFWQLMVTTEWDSVS